MTIAKFLLGALFVGAGICHFLYTSVYMRIMPPALPQPRFLVQLSGAFEIALGVALLIPVVTRPAAWGLIALLIAVFPANVHMAMHPELFPRIPAWSMWVRLPLQAALIAWAHVYTRTGI